MVSRFGLCMVAKREIFAASSIRFSSVILLLVTGVTEIFWLLTALQIVTIVDVL